MEESVRVDGVPSGVYWPRMAQPKMVFQALGLLPLPGLESGNMTLHTRAAGLICLACRM